MIAQVYVSRSLIAPADRTRLIDDILAVSIARNTTLGVTGLLIAAPTYFAQLLQGPERGVAAVMSSITADSRHTELRVIRHGPIEKASCPHWRMARFDHDNFGNTAVDPLLAAAHTGTDANAVRRLERFIEAVATDTTLSNSYLFDPKAPGL